MLEKEIHGRVRFRALIFLHLFAPLTRNDIYISRRNEHCCRLRGGDRPEEETLLTVRTSFTLDLTGAILGTEK